MIIKGYEKSIILEELAKQECVSQRSIERTYHKVLKEVAKLAAEDREDLRATLLARLDHLYRAAEAEGKWKNANDAILTSARIAGLFDKEAVEQKQPEVIMVETKDFSEGLSVVPKDKSENG